MTTNRSHEVRSSWALRPAVATALLVAWTPASNAQPRPDASNMLEEIIVTATRRSESVQDVPYNIQAISAQTLQAMGALDQNDFARMVPGLSMVDRGARDGVDFVLRGLTTGSNRGTLGETTTTYVDDTQVDLYYGLLDLKLLDVDRIEVLRGPQGTLYGGGAIGGTIRYISTPPDLQQMHARVGATVSSTNDGGDNYDATGMLNLPLIDDKLAVRINLGQFDNDGYIDNVRLGKDDVNWDRTLSGRIAVLARPIEALEINLTHYYQRGSYGADSSAFEFLGDDRIDIYEPSGEGERHVNLTNLSMTYDFGWGELTSSSSYVDERARNFDDSTYFIRDQVFSGFLPSPFLPEITVSTDRRRDAHTFSQELRLVSKDTERWDWLAGVYWYDRTGRERLQERVPIPFPGQDDFEDIVIGAQLNDDREYYFTSDPSTTNQWAVFGEVGLRITPQLRMSVGARHFDYRLRETFYAIDQYFGPGARDANGRARTTPLPQEFNFGRADDDGQIYRFNASYDLTPDDLVYVTIAEGYRPGGFNLVTPNTGVPINQRAYDPDSIVSYELGGKITALDQRVYLSSAIYYIDWSDIQTLVPTSLGFIIMGNAGKATARGFELELQSRGLLLDDLSMTLGYSYTKVRLEESIVGLGLAGDPAPRVPEQSGSFMLDYALGHGAWHGGVNVSTTYTGESFSTFGPFIPNPNGSLRPDPLHLEQDAYWLTNVSARFGMNDWTLRLFVDNVFDERAPLFRAFENSNSDYRDPYVRRSANRPRTIGLQLTWEFD